MNPIITLGLGVAAYFLATWLKAGVPRFAGWNFVLLFLAAYLFWAIMFAFSVAVFILISSR
jgi:hypothetical protein